MLKEHQIRPKELYREYIRLALIDAYAMGNARHSIPCPGCGSEQCLLACEKYQFQYDKCGKCHTLFCNPRPTRGDLDFFYKEGPAAQFWYEVIWPQVEETRRAEIFVPRVEEILKYCDQNIIRLQKVLDIGAGNGIFLEEFRKKMPSLEYRAIEPGSKSIAKCRERNLQCYQATVENVRDLDEWADLAICFEVIEHSHDPEKFISSIYKTLADQGIALITCLNYQGADMRILKERSSQVLPPLHLNFMSLTGYRNLFARCGFREIDIISPGKLDLDILSNAFAEGVVDERDLGPFMSWMITQADTPIRDKFQKYLAESGMSSHIWIWAKK